LTDLLLAPVTAANGSRGVRPMTGCARGGNRFDPASGAEHFAIAAIANDIQRIIDGLARSEHYEQTYPSFISTRFTKPQGGS